MLRMKRHPRPSDPATAPCGGTVAPGGRFRRQPSPSSHRPADAASLAMIRGVALAAVTAVSLAPVAAVTPSPSPSLGTLLAAPPASNYVVDTQAFMRVEGAFDVAEYVNFLAPSNPSEMETTLKHDGFVSGFGRSWAQQGTTHLLLEIVVAFRGATGAKSWLAASGAADSSNQYFKGAIVVSGVDPSYGGHFADPAAPAYADIVAFVKGNDYFLIGILSASDDIADSASTHTRKQYDLAPPNTIPSAQWPENATRAANRSASLPVVVALGILVLVFFAAVAMYLVVIVRRGSRRDPVFAYAAMQGGIQMSPDGNYWWDGQAWKDASSAAPAGSLRSADGYYWWDGRMWRPVP